MIPDFMKHVSKTWDSTGHTGDVIALVSASVLVLVAIIWFIRTKAYKTSHSSRTAEIVTIVLFIGIVLMFISAVLGFI